MLFCDYDHHCTGGTRGPGESRRITATGGLFLDGQRSIYRRTSSFSRICDNAPNGYDHGPGKAIEAIAPGPATHCDEFARPGGTRGNCLLFLFLCLTGICQWEGSKNRTSELVLIQISSESRGIPEYTVVGVNICPQSPSESTLRQRHGREACRWYNFFPFSLDLSIRLEALGAMLFRQLF